MGRQGNAGSNTIDTIDESRIHGRADGDWEPLAVVRREGDYRLLMEGKTDEATTDVNGTELRVRVFGEDEQGNLLEVGAETLSDSITDAENALVTYLARALDTLGDDEVRTVQIGTDTGATAQKIIAEQLDTAVADTDVGQLTYAARALNSRSLDEFVTRVTDSTGTQVDPLTTDPLQGVANDELRSRIHDSGGTQIDPLNQDILQTVANDEARTRLFGLDDGGALQEAQVEALDTGVAAGTFAQITYLARALSSQGLDEFITRVTDSNGVQIDPLNQDALDSVANDELRSLLLGTDTGGADQKVIAEQLDTIVANTDVAILTWIARALNDIGLDELVTRVTDDTGTQINPATNEDQPNYFDDDIVSHDLIGTGDYDIAETNVRGTGDIIIKVDSADDATFTVTLEWTDGAGTVLYSQSPAEGTDVTDANLKFNVSSDHFQLNITDTSGGAQNNINGTVNAH